MRGAQDPCIRIVPKYAYSDGADATELMRAYSSTPDKWQADILDCWLAKDAAGKYLITSAGLSAPRQNGKNVCLEAREFFGMAVHGEKILHTAHQVKTSKKSFRRLAAIFTDRRFPEITDMVKNIRYTNGEEAIELENGAVIEFASRSRQSARGFDGISLVVYDEAQELTDEQVDAIMATLSASATGTRQLIYTGTPPYPGCPGTVFRRRRATCLSDPGAHDSWHEWGVQAGSIDDIKIDDTLLWYMTNPAMGVRLDEDFTLEEMRTMSADGFARERLGWWAPTVSAVEEEKAIDAEAWEACGSTEPKPEGKTAYGVKFAPDGSEVCLCGAVIPKDGAARISLIAREPISRGTGWLAEWLNQRYKKASCVVIDGKNGVDVLIDKIADTWKMKGSIVRAGANDVIAAVGTLSDSINERSVTWYKPQTDMDDSAKTSTRRKIGSGGGWGFGGENPLPVEAAALALWGAKTSKRDPNRRMRIG